LEEKTPDALALAEEEVEKRKTQEKTTQRAK